MITLLTDCKLKQANMQTQSKIIAFRLKPHQDLKAGIEEVVQQNKIEAGYTISNYKIVQAI
jgi:predicted DNA-binding protein with PD1-like motif